MNRFQLIVADCDPAFRTSVAAVLRLEGYPVTACDPDRAHLILQSVEFIGNRYILPVVGVDTRHLKSVKLARAFRAASYDVLAIVGCCDRMMREEIELLGCSRLDKPVDRSDLLAGVRSLLHQRHALLVSSSRVP